MIAAGVIWHGFGGLSPDLAGWKQAHALMVAAFPDILVSVEDQVAEGDMVVTRWTFSGTHRGDLFGIPPTGKRVAAGGIVIDRVAGGKIVEHWIQFDQMGLLQQLGVVPPQAGG